MSDTETEVPVPSYILYLLYSLNSLSQLCACLRYVAQSSVEPDRTGYNFFFLCLILKFLPISDQYQTLVSGRAASYCNQFHCFNKNVLTAISLSCSVHPKAPCLILGTTAMVFFFFFRNCIRGTVSEMMFSHWCFHRECVMTHQIAACKKFAKNCLHQTKITVK